MELPKYKIQLHTHLETHARISTVWELESKKKLGLGYTSAEDFKRKVRPEKASTLRNYLKEIVHYYRLFVGDRDAVVRLAYEAGVDQANQGILYTEMRICPYTAATDFTHLKGYTGAPSTLKTPEDVIEAILEGFKKAEAEHDIQLRLVLGMFRDKPEWSRDLLDLVEKYKDRGVVGIDVTGVIGNEKMSEEYGEEILGPDTIATFQKAAVRGIRRIAHAGEAGPPGNIKRAIEVLKAERIGHGYSAIAEGGEAYKLALERGIHFEQNITSSYLTGGVKEGQVHPILRLIRDKASFSINYDGPTITQVTMDHEYQLLLSMGANVCDIIDSNLSAIKACFLPEKEKEALMKKYKKLNGLENYEPRK
ncbi:adenosine deaminase-like [Ornithodoros turicata]|uniref:adenosine deaminase-like n=1 Tax=Ornithodoros turicata TaxID=34597 RepID=UPI00313973EF